MKDLSDKPLTAREGAAASGLSISAFWRAVREDRLPSPVYPLPRAPRWFSSEIREAMLKTRARPTEAMAARRAAKFAA